MAGSKMPFPARVAAGGACSSSEDVDSMFAVFETAKS
jgi:hypothetical protein